MHSVRAIEGHSTEHMYRSRLPACHGRCWDGHALKMGMAAGAETTYEPRSALLGWHECVRRQCTGSPPLRQARRPRIPHALTWLVCGAIPFGRAAYGLAGVGFQAHHQEAW